MDIARRFTTNDQHELPFRRGCKSLNGDDNLSAGLEISSRRSLLKAIAGAALSVSKPTRAAALPNEFFVMDTAMVSKYSTPLTRSDIAMAAQLGYSGIAPDVSGVQTWDYLTSHVLTLLGEYRLQLTAVFCAIHVTRDGFTISPEIARHLPALQGQGTTIWISIAGASSGERSLRPSDPAGDVIAVEAIRQVAETAAKSNCKVSLYPHFATLIERVEDVVRICEKVDRKNVGVTFNLCHYLRSEPNVPLARVLDIARPHLTLVTTCGADTNGADWKQLIQPLDQGTFPQQTLLAELRRIDYRGPIGLQGYDAAKNYNIDPSENLRRSMAAWKKLNRA